MTVRELIVQLMAQPQDATVVLNLDLNERANSCTPSVVRLALAFSRDHTEGRSKIYWGWEEYVEEVDSDYSEIAESVVVVEA